MVTQVQRIFQPGERAQATIQITNTGNVPATFIVELAPGTAALFGPFISEGIPLRIITPIVQPGQEASVALPVTFSDIPGAKDFQIRVGQAGPTGGFLNILDEQVFAGLARVEAPAGLPLPVAGLPAGAAPLAPTPLDAAQVFSLGLGTPTVSFSDSRPTTGEVIQGRIDIPNNAGIPFSPVLEVNIAIIDRFPPFSVQEIRTIIAPITVSLQPNQDISRNIAINTTGLPVTPGGESPYDLRVVLLDEQTGILLLDAALQDVFTVLDAAVPAPPALPVAPLPPPSITAQPGPGDLDSIINIVPSDIVVGELATLTYGIFNRQNFDISSSLSINLVNSRGLDIVSIVPPRPLIIDADSQRTADVPINTSTLGPDSYGVRVLVIAAGTGTTLLDEVIPNKLTVRSAVVPATALLGLQAGQLTLVTQQPGFPLQVPPGSSQTLNLRFQVADFILPSPPEITMEFRVKNSFGATIETLAPQFITFRPGETRDVAVRWDIPPSTPEARYGIEVEAFDPNTLRSQGRLVQVTLFPLWEVVSPRAMVTADLTGALVSPASLFPGQTATITIPLRNSGGADSNVSLSARLINPNGRPGDLPVFVSLTVPAQGSFTHTQGFTVPTTEGSYDLRVAVIEAGTGNILFDSTVVDTFSVIPLIIGPEQTV